LGNCKNLSKSTTNSALFEALKWYYQIELDKESQDLRAFMTLFDQYIYLQLPFGTPSAGNVFTPSYWNVTDVAIEVKRLTKDTLIRENTSVELLTNSLKHAGKPRSL
jgi:hypothetical protein